jgi:cytochrome c-type biogenesis protein
LNLMPIAVALVAGSLAALNPCGFPLLPAFLSYYVGAEEHSLPRGPSQVAQGLVVGATVASGFLGVFAALAIPISLGATRLTSAVPWAGLVVGAGMAVIGGLAAAGRHMGLTPPPGMRARRGRGVFTMVIFGAGYAICSLGCSLPIFLALIGASLASAGITEAFVILEAYGLGMATTVMALSVGAALARDGLARALGGLLPHMHRIAGGLLLVSGVYLSYYWGRVLWAPPEALSTDPLVTVVSSFANWAQGSAASGGGRLLVLTTGAVVAVAFAGALWRLTDRADRTGSAETQAAPARHQASRSVRRRTE